MSPMQYARSGLGTAELNGKLIAAGKRNSNNSIINWLSWSWGGGLLHSVRFI